MVKELDASSFKKEVLQHKGFVLVDFWAAWCGPCKMIAPVLEKLAPTYDKKVTFAKLNVDDFSDVAQEYGVMSIPCLIIFKDGEEVDRIVGYGGEAPLRDKLDALK